MPVELAGAGAGQAVPDQEREAGAGVGGVGPPEPLLGHPHQVPQLREREFERVVTPEEDDAVEGRAALEEVGGRHRMWELDPGSKAPPSP